MSSLAHEPAAARRPREVGQDDSIAARVARTVAAWRRRARSRTELAHLDERELRDIGLTPTDAAWECAKPFWRD